MCVRAACERVPPALLPHMSACHDQPQQAASLHEQTGHCWALLEPEAWDETSLEARAGTGCLQASLPAAQPCSPAAEQCLPGSRRTPPQVSSADASAAVALCQDTLLSTLQAQGVTLDSILELTQCPDAASFSISQCGAPK